MKRCVELLLMIGAIMMVLIGATSSFAMGKRANHYEGYKWSGNDTGKGYQVPEPATLSLVGTGIAGVGILYAVRRRNNKK